MTIATVCTWARTGRDARAPFTLASEMHFDPFDSTATRHASLALDRTIRRAESAGLRIGHYSASFTVMASPDDLVERVVTYSEDDPGEWNAARVRALVGLIELPPLPIEHNRRN